MIDEKIKNKQKWNNKDMYFQPDSSPDAWDYYKKVYCKAEFAKDYNFDSLHFYNSYKTIGLKGAAKIGEEWANFVDKPLENENRLYALKRNTKMIEKDGNTFFLACCRLGGECDFNFNKKKMNLFRELIENDSYVSTERKDEADGLLKICEEGHHKLFNFSLMESMGNLQGFKGANRFDRLDTFVYELNLYYKGLSNRIIIAANEITRAGLIAFLNKFKDVYHYCKEIYLIEDKEFIEKIIQNGSNPITNTSELIQYMNFALEFWKQKKEYFCHKCGNNFDIKDYSIPPLCDKCSRED